MIRFYLKNHKKIDDLIVAILAILGGVALPFVINILEAPWR